VLFERIAMKFGAIESTTTHVPEGDA